jgi:putative ABC transport system permease protein
VMYGNGDSAFTKPFTAALSASSAKKLFGSTDVVGKTVKLNRNNDYTVTAVYEDMPANTQLKPDILLSYPTFQKWTTDSSGNGPETAWAWDGCLTYVQLRKDTDPMAVEKKFIPIVERAT